MKQTSNNDEFKKIVIAIKDYVFDKHKVCGLDEISSITNIPRAKCSKLLPSLIGQKQIYEIFSGVGKPSLYLPYDMMQTMLNLQAKPAWLSNLQRKEKIEDIKKKEKLNSEISKFEEFERLLYATGKPLEKAIASSLEFLEFENVVFIDNEESHDIEFSFEGNLGIIESKGKCAQGDKEDVQQLRGWIDKKVDEGNKADKLTGFLLINHFRGDNPSERDIPLTDKAIQFLKIGNFKFFATPSLYKLIQEVMDGKISKKDARNKFWQGEKYG